jgi:hypothetical protein
MVGLTGTGLFAGVVLLVFSFRWGLRLILDPAAMPPIQAWLTSPLTSQSPQTITYDTLQQLVTDSGQVLGEPVRISERQADADWLIFPVLEADSGNIVKLRLLRKANDSQGSETFIDVASVEIAPFSADAILAPFPPQERQTKVAPTRFSARQFTRLPKPPIPTPYHWLTLEGQWSNQGIRLRYGQIVLFNPARRRLDLLAVWSSPAGQKPQWIDLDGEGFADLVIDETTSMDPMLRGLQVQDLPGLGPSLQLQPVSWVGVPLDAGHQASPYQRALRLARNGLWHESHQRMKELKASLADEWNGAAEAQLRLVARHAALTRQQAEQDWSLPTQKIMALLFDGQWSSALQELEESPQQLAPIMRRLAADQGRLWNRINTAASLESPDPAVFVWGGLTLEAQQNRPAAQQWLDRQPVDAATKTRLTAIQTALENSSTTLVTEASSQTHSGAPAEADVDPGEMATRPPLVQGVIGPVKPVVQFRPDDWYFPDDQPPALVQGEGWYTIEVPIIRSDRAWQTHWPRTVETGNPELFWAALPFAQTPSMTMVRWESSTLGISHNLYVKGLKKNDTTVTLLASGPLTQKASHAPLAFSDGALVWLSAAQQATPDQDVMTPLLEELRRHHGPLPEHVGTFAFAALLQEVKLHALDLTGDGRLEQVLTFDRDALGQLQGLGIKLDRTAHKTVILTEAGDLLYSDLFQPQSLIALTNPADGLPLSLVTYGAGEYRIFQWSDTEQAFIP